MYSAARFARAFFRSQINYTPSGNIRRNRPFANSFRFRSYANRPILHYFGANKSFRIRSCRHPSRNSFIIRSYENPWGVEGSPLSTFSPVPSAPSAPSVNSSVGLSSARLSPSETNNLELRTANLHGSQVTRHSSRSCGKKPRDRPPDLHNFGAPITTFRINTCISVASKRLYLPLESTLMKKPGEGGAHPLTAPMVLTRPEAGEGGSG